MKRFLLIITILSISSLATSAREYEVYGPQGGLSMKVTLPKDFDTETEKCPMVRLVHGSKDTIVPLSCSDKFVEAYTQDADLIIVEGGNHTITRKLKTVVSHAVSFFASRLK